MSRKWSSSTWFVSRRSSAASEARSASRIAGSVASSSRNWARGRIAVSDGSIATAVADRGAPSSSASSPKTSPARSVARIASSPVSLGNMILIAPDTTMNSASPGSPRWKITSPRRNRRVRMPRVTRSRLAASSPEKNGMAAKVSASGRAEIMSRILLRPGMVPLPARLPVCRLDDTGSVALPAGRPPARRGNIRAMPSESVYP